MVRDKFDYTHGDTGTKPTSSENFESNERPDSENFDWFWYSVISKINTLFDELTRLDSDDDGVVDEADDADTVDGNHASAFATSGHDHDGRYYTQSEIDSQPSTVDVRTSDPSSPEDGQTWIRSDL